MRLTIKITRSPRPKPDRDRFTQRVRHLLAVVSAKSRAGDWFRIGFGLIWLLDAAFKWQSGFRQGFMGMVMGEGVGQPGWMHGWFQFWINFQHPHVMFFAYLTAIAETVIALALIFGVARKYLFIFGVLFSLTIWGTAEGFGGPYGSTSTDIGAAVMYSVVFLGLLALSYEGGPSHFSVDYLIEQRVSWWHRIAEFGPRGHSGELLRRPPVTSIDPPDGTGTAPTSKVPPAIDVPTEALPVADAPPLVTSNGRR